MYVNISYSPGDVAMIQPDNMTFTVDAFIELLDLDPEQLFTLQENDPGIYYLCAGLVLKHTCCINT